MTLRDQQTTLAHNGSFILFNTIWRFGQKAENLTSKMLSWSSLLPTAAFLLAVLPDTELWGSHHGCWAIIFQELEVSYGKHKLEEWKLWKCLSGLNGLLRQSRVLKLSHLSYSSLASPIEEPTKQGCKTHSVGWMNHYSCFRQAFLQCGARKKGSV